MKRLMMRVFAVQFCLLAMFGFADAQTSEAADPLVTKAAALVPQSGEGDDIRSAFNANVDRVRLMVLLSPT